MLKKKRASMFSGAFQEEGASATFRV